MRSAQEEGPQEAASQARPMGLPHAKYVLTPNATFGLYSGSIKACIKKVHGRCSYLAPPTSALRMTRLL